VSADLPDLTEPHDPALEGLVRALTADGTASEMAGRDAALAMFQARRRPPRRRGFALSISTRSVSTVAAAAVLAGGIGAAYAAALPGPVQHIAYRMLDRIGVPDTHQPAPAGPGPGPGAGAAATVPAAPSATAGCPCPASHPGASAPGASAVPGLALMAAQAKIPAGAGDVLTGRLAPGGRPEAGVRVRLLEHAGNGPGWRAAGHAVTDRSGDVTLTVRRLTSNASFRLAAPGGAVSPPVLITVIPPVRLGQAPGRQHGTRLLTARAPFADTGDVVVLEELSDGVWHRVGQRVLGQNHLASFSVLVPRSGGVEYRAVLRRTATHGAAVSGPVRIAAARATRGRPAPP
jgi:hypothetical protein